FRLAVGVVFGVVEEVDAVVPGQRHQFARLAAPEPAAGGEPAAQRQRRQFQARASKAAVTHGRLRIGCAHSLCDRRAGAMRRAARYPRAAFFRIHAFRMQEPASLRRVLASLFGRPDEVMLELGASGELLVAKVRALLSLLTLAL